MKALQDMMNHIITTGHARGTRSGEVISKWNCTLNFSWVKEQFPATTAKTLAWKSVVGELLWFLSGSESVVDLRQYTFGPYHSADKWTIWTDDARRWNNSNGGENPDFVGALYGTAWRDFDRSGVDQIANVIKNIKEDPYSRDHVVMAWNPKAIANNEMALKPCHMGFQLYVDGDDCLNMKWFQRSNDVFLGAPFNIASYALLLNMLAEWTGYDVGHLSGCIGDYHIYTNQMEAIEEYLTRTPGDLPSLVLPEKAKSFDTVLELTALDFEDALVDYSPQGIIKAPLSVG